MEAVLAEWGYDELETLSAPDARAAGRQARQPGAGAARGARPETGRRDRRALGAGRPQRPHRTAHAPEHRHLDRRGDRIAAARRRGRACRRSPRALTPAGPLPARTQARRGHRRPGARLARYPSSRRRIRMRKRRGRAAGARGVRQADESTRGGGRLAVPAAAGGGAAARGQRGRLAGRAHLRVPGPHRQGRDARRARRRHRPRDRPRRPPRQYPLGAARRRVVVAVRDAARRFRRRRRGRDRGHDHPADELFARGRSRRRPLRRAADGQDRRRPARAGHDPAADRRRHPSGESRSCSIIPKPASA